MFLIKKILAALYTIYKFTIFAVVLGVSTSFFGGLVFILMPFFKPRTVGKLTGVPWARVNSFMTPVILSVTGREHIDKNQSYVLVCNHQSHYDIFVLYGWIGIDIRWVMKASLRKVLVIGPACEKLKHVYIDRSNTAAALESLNQAKERISNGTSVVFFPEGTRSQNGELLPFKKGAFKMAMDIGLPLLPVTISGTSKILPKGTIRLFPGKAKMTIHPPVQVDGYSDENIRELMNSVRDTIQSAL